MHTVPRPAEFVLELVVDRQVIVFKSNDVAHESALGFLEVFEFRLLHRRTRRVFMLEKHDVVQRVFQVVDVAHFNVVDLLDL